MKATAHQVLTYDGAPAFTQFTASSGGWTVDGGAPYLPPGGPVGQPEGPYHAWTVPFRDTEIEAAWPAVGDLARIELGQRDGHGEWVAARGRSR